MCLLCQQDGHLGGDAQNKCGVLLLKHSIEHSTMINQDETEKVCHHILHQALHVAPEGHPVFLTEAI